MKYQEGTDFVVRAVKGFPSTIHGAIMYDDEGRANIYINADLTSEQFKKAVEHELWHMIYDDMNNPVDSITDIES